MAERLGDAQRGAFEHPARRIAIIDATREQPLGTLPLVETLLTRRLRRPSGALGPQERLQRVVHGRALSDEERAPGREREIASPEAVKLVVPREQVASRLPGGAAGHRDDVLPEVALCNAPRGVRPTATLDVRAHGRCRLGQGTPDEHRREG
jgi:hypothetical protein